MRVETDWRSNGCQPRLTPVILNVERNSPRRSRRARKYVISQKARMNVVIAREPKRPWQSPNQIAASPPAPRNDICFNKIFSMHRVIEKLRRYFASNCFFVVFVSFVVKVIFRCRHSTATLRTDLIRQVSTASSLRRERGPAPHDPVTGHPGHAMPRVAA